MPRLLPWQVSGAAQSKTTFPTPSSVRKRKQPTLSEEEDDLLDGDLNLVHEPPRSGKGKRAIRDASSSPPPISSAPPVVFMQEGADDDDRWMMVEDEFYTTAKIFTQHIHHAEYIRKTEELKARQEQGGAAHFTDGRTQQSRETQLGLVAEANERKIKAAMEAQNGDDSDLDNADPHLAGLMTGSRAPVLDLTHYARTQPSTRAAAGFQQSPRKEQRTYDASTPASAEKAEAAHVISTDDDDDDLDRPLRKQTQPPRALPISPKKEMGGSLSKPASHAEPSSSTSSRSVFAQFSRRSISESKPNALVKKDANMQASPPASKWTPVAQSKAEPKVKQGSLARADLDAIIKAETPSYQAGSSYLARKRAARERRLKEKEKASQAKIKSEYEIPTFL